MTAATGRPLDLALPALVSAAMIAVAVPTMGSMAFAVFLFAFGGGLVFYGLTLWRRRIDARAILVPYLCTVVLFILHVWEEYLADFENVVSVLSGRPIAEEGFLSVAGFIAPALWVSGAILILLRLRLGDYFLCVFFFAMVFAELAHFVFPFAIDGTFHYEAGMYTAALPLIPAFWGLRRMARLMREG